MLRRGLINAQLVGALAHLRHTDVVVVSDSGLPVPKGVEVVDLAVTYGVPGFKEVLIPLLEAIVFESSTAAVEVKSANPGTWEFLTRSLGHIDLIAHEEFKVRTRSATLVIRTGEDTPYANVMLTCGVPFG